MSKKEMNAALMDFGSALCVARPRCEACPLQKRCVYYKEGGRQEARRQKSVPGKNVPWGNAEVIVFLHENHKQYFSSHAKRFQPFVLSAGYNTRAGIKKYFLGKYGLTLSVRPPHKRLVLSGKPALLVNAQILLGTPSFPVFSKSAVEEYNKEQG